PVSRTLSPGASPAPCSTRCSKEPAASRVWPDQRRLAARRARGLQALRIQDSARIVKERSPNCTCKCTDVRTGNYDLVAYKRALSDSGECLNKRYTLRYDFRAPVAQGKRRAP